MASSVSARRKATTGGGQLASVLIEFKGNGFEVTKGFTPKTGKGGFPIYENPKPKDSVVFTEPGAMLTYIESCVGKREHAAHEKAEGKHGY